LGHPS